MKSLKNKILNFTDKNFKVKPEYLWAKFPNYCVLRHPNGKWFAAIMTVEKGKLIANQNENTIKNELVDIIVIKCDPLLKGSLLSKKGYLPAYHMNKEHWITILLDGTVAPAEIYPLLTLSFQLQKPNKQKKHNFCN